MDKQLLREIISDQKKQKTLQSDFVERDVFSHAIKLQKADNILVIAGVRRAGKSVLLQQLRQSNSDQDYYLNFEDERLVDFTVDDFQKLLEVFIELFGEQQIFYFDEIQNIIGWERFVRRLYNNGYKIIITGSNATMLSQEFGTHLTGRYCQITLFPFSFREYLHYHKICYPQKIKNIDTTGKASMQKYFGEYMQNGGFPGFVKSLQIEQLQSLYEGVLYRDIIARYHINKITELKTLINFAASNIGKSISFNKLKVLLQLGNASTIKDFFDYLRNTYLFFLLPQFDYSLKKQILANKKVYIIDTSLAKLLGFRFSDDAGRMLENLVFLELMRQKKEIYYHSDKKECDFIVKENGKIVTCIQVTMHIFDEATKQREIEGLLEAMQCYHLSSGMLLTYDTEGEKKITISKFKRRYTVQILPVWKWMCYEDVASK